MTGIPQHPQGWFTLRLQGALEDGEARKIET